MQNNPNASQNSLLVCNQWVCRTTPATLSGARSSHLSHRPVVKLPAEGDG